MPITITPTERKDITKLVCPECGERLRSVGLLSGSKIEGLTFKCRRCGKLWNVKSE